MLLFEGPELIPSTRVSLKVWLGDEVPLTVVVSLSWVMIPKGMVHVVAAGISAGLCGVGITGDSDRAGNRKQNNRHIFLNIRLEM